MKLVRFRGAAMKLRKVVSAAAMACACVTAVAGAASWTPVPGAPEVAIDLASVHLERTRVTVWVRWWGRPAIAPELASHTMRQLRVNRSALLTEFDCARRTMRTLALHAYDGAGAPVFMSSVPGPVLPVEGEELVWTYDAVCEAARAGARF
jgi:hypothetical protein